MMKPETDFGVQMDEERNDAAAEIVETPEAKAEESKASEPETVEAAAEPDAKEPEAKAPRAAGSKQW